MEHYVIQNVKMDIMELDQFAGKTAQAATLILELIVSNLNPMEEEVDMYCGNKVNAEINIQMWDARKMEPYIIQDVEVASIMRVAVFVLQIV